MWRASLSGVPGRLGGWTDGWLDALPAGSGVVPSVAIEAAEPASGLDTVQQFRTLLVLVGAFVSSRRWTGGSAEGTARCGVLELARSVCLAMGSTLAVVVRPGP